MRNAIVLATALLCACFSTGFAYTDSDILNFGLNLKCLEAEYYSWGAFGKGLTSAQRGGGPPSIGGKKADLNYELAIIQEFAMESIRHVEVIRGALGKLAVPCPKMDIGPAIEAAANLAFGRKTDPAFNAYEEISKFLHGALFFEEVGVMAFNGAIGVISSPAYAAAARSILSVQSSHAGILRLLLSQFYDISIPPYDLTGRETTGALIALIDGLLGLERKQPIGSFGKMPNLTPTDANALAYAVTPSAALNVFYLSKTAMKGGFFPEGINGLLGQTRGNLGHQCTGNTKAGRYEQCGGLKFVGPTCCEGLNTCVKQNEYYSQCLPKMPPTGVVAAYGKCGGSGYQGPTKCEPGSTCVKKTEFYSQCTPNSKP